MDIQKISHLVELLSQSTLNDLTLTEGDTSLSLSKGGRAVAASTAEPGVVARAAAPMATAATDTTVGVAAVADAAPVAPAQPGGMALTSPLVGTFYRASAPDAAPFVQVGDHVEEGQTVAVVEAMKMLNEVQAEQAGEIVEIHAENGTFVEFGQPLFTILASR